MVMSKPAHREIRIGIVGAGMNVVKNRIPVFQTIEGACITAVCNRSYESSFQSSRELGIPKAAGNWKELVEAQDVDAILIGTRPNLHCAVTLAAISAGKHVLCESRMAMDGAEARRMMEASVARPDLVCRVTPTRIAAVGGGHIKALIDEGFLGKILYIQVRDFDHFLETDSPLHWRQQSEYSGYNALTLGMWYETLVGWIGTAKSVTSRTRIFVPIRKDESGVGHAVQIPDHIDVVADMHCGAQVHFVISRAAVLPPPTEVVLYGTEGIILYRGGRIFVGQRNGTELTEVIRVDEKQGGKSIEHQFIDEIHGTESTDLLTFRDGLQYMIFTEAVHLSACYGRTIRLVGMSLY